MPGMFVSHLVAPPICSAEHAVDGAQRMQRLEIHKSTMNQKKSLMLESLKWKRRRETKWKPLLGNKFSVSNKRIVPGIWNNVVAYILYWKNNTPSRIPFGNFFFRLCFFLLNEKLPFNQLVMFFLIISRSWCATRPDCFAVHEPSCRASCAACWCCFAELSFSIQWATGTLNESILFDWRSGDHGKRDCALEFDY